MNRWTFTAFSDHAALLGILRAMADPSTEISKHPDARKLTDTPTNQARRGAFRTLLSYASGGRYTELLDMNEFRSAWQDIVDAANRHNDPGNFTAFIAYEYTSAPDSQNLHRNVIFRDDRAPDVPFSRFDSSNPEDLWRWMDNLRGRGIESLAIPHNSNGSNGQMFRLTDFDSDPLDGAYADLRMRNEPLVEITQVKGTSDTHPLVSPNDEWADFEVYPYRIASWLESDIKGSYVREAYLNGIAMAKNQGFNPFRFGVVGSSDTHNASYAGDEAGFYGKVGVMDGAAVRRGSVPLDQPREDGGKYANVYYHLWGASGLAGVWAEANTRDAIYEAFRRKETFATTGPRIKVRFFAGYDLPSLDDKALAEKAYEKGVAMGADLVADSHEVPQFIVWATRDARGAPLQRLQVIKGFVENDRATEKIYDVACSDGLAVNPGTRRCPDNGASVNLKDCSITPDAGAAELKTVWQDPDFDPGQRAFYYVRVLENPTCRWSTWDAVRAGVKPRPDIPATIQERAWSSPIWFTPAVEGDSSH